ncbi:hypothetical protein MRX96_057108 [Rhipicephalus microplus]
MPAQIYPHAVFGFCEILDWTTLHFVKPIDDIRVCSACRAVSRKTAFLACRHVLCQPCFENWKSTRSNTCVIDGDLCPEKEVYWIEFPAEKMMKSEVSCWNWDNGCQIVTDVSSITNHFHQDCEHHSTCCPKCSSTVLRKDVIAHLESGCANHVLRIRSTTPPNDVELNDLESIREDTQPSGQKFPLNATARIFENELKVPVKVLWCVWEWSVLRAAITSTDFCFALTGVIVDGRYGFRISIVHRIHKPLFRIVVSVPEKDWATFAVLTKNVSLFFISRRKCGAENKINLRRTGSASFETDDLNIEDAQLSEIIQGGMLKMCLTFSY